VRKEVLSRRTDDYRNWVEACARHHNTPYGLGRERPPQRGSRALHYTAWKSVERTASISSSRAWNSRTLRITVPKVPTQDPNHRILAHLGSRFTHYYYF
jgi:hypothetical protein